MKRLPKNVVFKVATEVQLAHQQRDARHAGGAVAQVLSVNRETWSRRRDLLPICAWCNRIRDDDGSWIRIENYAHEYTVANFTHGICPECREKVERKAREKQS